MSYPTMSTAVPWSLVKGGFRKSPQFESVVQKTAGGRGRSVLSLQPYPTWNFEVDLNLVLGGEAISGSVLQDFLGCYMAAAGAGGFFLFTDPNDNAVLSTEGLLLNVTPGAAGPMAQDGDGVSTVFQLARNIGQGVDIVQQVSSVDVLRNGSSQTLGTDYSIDDLGVVTFAVAPDVHDVLASAFNFQYLCNFTEDTLKTLARVNKNSQGFLWECNSIQFESVFL